MAQERITTQAGLGLSRTAVEQAVLDTRSGPAPALSGRRAFSAAMHKFVPLCAGRAALIGPQIGRKVP